jgi:hypothetical protein
VIQKGVIQRKFLFDFYKIFLFSYSGLLRDPEWGEVAQKPFNFFFKK